MGSARTSPVSSMEIKTVAQPAPAMLAACVAMIACALWLAEVAVVCWLL